MTESLRQHSQSVMHGAPLFPVAAGLVAGIAADRSLQLPLVIYVVGFALMCVIACVRSARAVLASALLLVASLCVGGTWHLSTARTIPPSSIERYVRQTERIARIRGAVASPPRILTSGDNPFARWTYGGERTAFLLQTTSIEGVDGDIRVTGLIRVTVREAVLDLRENEKVEVFGWLYRFRPPMNPGAFDWRSFYRRQGVIAGLSCNLQENIRRLDVAPPRPHGGLIARMRKTVRGMLTDDLATGTDEEASLLEAMILGHRSGLDRRLNDVFIRSGCIHFLAVSGVHVVIVMALARLVCRALMLPLRMRTWAMLVAIIAYALIAEPRPPILRASVIASLYCIARLLGRQRACLNWISASAIVLVVFKPVTVFDVGFQLSFCAVFGVSYLTPAIVGLVNGLSAWWRRVFSTHMPFADDLKPIEPAGRNVTLAFRGTRWLRRVIRGYAPSALAITAGAWLAALPIIAVHFQRVQLWAALNSLLVFPLVALVMGLGFAKLIIGTLSPALGSLVAVPLIASDSALIWSVDHLAMLPGVSLPVQAPPWWLAFVYYGFLLTLIWRFPRRLYFDNADADTSTAQKTPQPQWAGRGCVGVLALLVGGLIWWCRPSAPEERLTITVLSVGAGSAMVVELPEGQTILCDSGSMGPYDVGRHTVLPSLRHHGIRRIDRVYISHPNLDHFSGLPTVFDEVNTGPVFINHCFEPKSPPRSPGRHLLRLLADRGQDVLALDPSITDWEYGGVRFERLSPIGEPDESLPANETSSVLRLSYAGHSILLTGDIENRTQRALLQRGDLRADVLILPHHGSMRPSSADFFRAVDADVLIRSSNQPMEETFNGLQEAIGTTPLYNTADVGAVRVVIDPSGVHLSSMCPEGENARATGIGR